MRVLGIETSCDETGLAVYDSQQGLLAHRLYSQIQLHRAYGGVVPELASRDHVRKTLPLLRELLQKAGSPLSTINGIAFTQGPGLIGALLVGVSIGKSLAFALNIPAVGVHHMEAHLLAPMLEEHAPDYPFMALLVSGGHTMLVEVTGLGHYRILGETLDDAAGEAFDKTAKMMGLPYPGGPELARLAENGNPERFRFPRPMTDRPGLEFSFSGLKTHTLNLWQRYSGEAGAKADIAAGFQWAVVDTLRIKCRRAMEQTRCSNLIIAGGVGANQLLREHLKEEAAQRAWQVYYPKPEFCTDNGAMIAYAGCQRLLTGQESDLKIDARPRWPIDSLKTIYGSKQVD